jgi:hypothetical protein
MTKIRRCTWPQEPCENPLFNEDSVLCVKHQQDAIAQLAAMPRLRNDPALRTLKIVGVILLLLALPTLLIILW